MRPIKFRVWDYYEAKFKRNAMLYNVQDCVKDFSLYIDNPNYALMQFAGLLDKNGREIYEGDIIQIQWGGGLKSSGTVEFADGCFRVMGNDRTYEWFSTLRSKIQKPEVIGNVHSNPELLTPKETL